MPRKLKQAQNVEEDSQVEYVHYDLNLFLKTELIKESKVLEENKDFFEVRQQSRIIQKQCMKVQVQKLVRSSCDRYRYVYLLINSDLIDKEFV